MLAFLASLGGAGLAGLIQTLFAPDFDGETLFLETLFVCMFGNLWAGLAAGLFSAWRKRQAGAAFALGLAVGSVPLLLDKIGTVGGALAALLVLAAAWFFGPRIYFGRVAAQGAGLGAGLVLALPFILGTPEVGSWIDPHPPLAPGAADSVASGPDYVLVVADTLRADAVLDEEIPTPHLDALRDRGTWAPYAISSNNQTLPSHLTLLTGLDVEKHGMRNNFSAWPEAGQLQERWKRVGLAERFQRGGWRTAAVVSNLLLDPSRIKPGLQGFDAGFETWYCRLPLDCWRAFGIWKAGATWYGLLTRLAGLNNEGNKFIRSLFNPHGPRGVRRHYEEGADTATIAVEYLDGLLADTKPYFLLVHFMDPHTPYIAPPPFHGSISDPSALPEDTDLSLEGEFELRETLREMLAEQRPREEWQPYADYLHDLYREEVAYFDAMLGVVLARIEKGGRPTVILVTSDHGEAFAEHGFTEHGKSLFLEEVAVPFVVAGPGVARGRILEDPAELVDAARTLIEHAGLDIAAANGRNVLEAAPSRPALALMPGRAVLERDGWRAYFRIEYGDPPELNNYVLTPLLLFDLTNDPGETRNLLGEHDRRVRDFQRALDARMADDFYPELTPRVLSRGDRENLAEHGYIDNE